MSGRARFCFLLFASLAHLGALQGQVRSAQLLGRVLFADSTTGAAGIVVIASDPAGTVIARALTGDRGEYLLPLPRPARYEVRALRIGFRPTVLPLITLAAGETRGLDIVLRDDAVALAAVTVRGESVCRGAPESGQLVVQLWEQARTALLATALGAGDAPIQTTARLYARTLDPAGVLVRSESSTVVRGATLRPFASVPPDSFARAGYVTSDSSGTTYRAPDAEVLLSESFATSHCFWTEPAPPDHPEWVGIGVRPARERQSFADVLGTLWLDRASSELRRFEYAYTGLATEVERAKPGGHVEFQRLPTGHWLVSRWAIRMPQTGLARSVEGFGASRQVRDRPVVRALRERGGETIDVRRDSTVLYHSDAAALAAAEEAARVALASAPAPTALPKTQGTVAVLSGRVTQAGDTAVLVPGAEIQLVGSGMRRWADNHGRFSFPGVPPGSYELRVRMLGYQPFAARAEIEEGRVYDQDIELMRLATALTEVRIQGQRVKVPARYEDVYRRGALGYGTFFTREQIEKRNPVDIAALLQEIPGVFIHASWPQTIDFKRCSDNKVQVYIDGVRMTRYGGPRASTMTPEKKTGPSMSQAGSPIDWDNLHHTLELVPPTAIQAMEVYRAVAEIPVEFLDDACAVIAIWTKAY